MPQPIQCPELGVELDLTLIENLAWISSQRQVL
jgi:hypothetical protein